jgi:hypothetical protein
MVGQWIRPWEGELVVGEVIFVSDEDVVCRMVGGFEFRVKLADAVAGKVRLWTREQIRHKQTLGVGTKNRAYRPTAKGEAYLNGASH